MLWGENVFYRRPGASPQVRAFCLIEGVDGLHGGVTGGYSSRKGDVCNVCHLPEHFSSTSVQFCVHCARLGAGLPQTHSSQGKACGSDHKGFVLSGVEGTLVLEGARGDMRTMPLRVVILWQKCQILGC